MNFRYRFMQFMSGRYGADNLFYVLLIFSMSLSVANCFLKSFVLQLFIYAAIIFAIFRYMSRNIEARRRENQAFRNAAQKLRQKREVYRQRRADYTHIYKKCPNCRAVLRLPRRKGKHTTVCPKCSKRFRVRVYKD